MGKEVIYRELNQDEAGEACRMVIDCFNEFVAPDYSDDGITEFLKYVDPNSMLERLARGNFVLVALKHKRVIGIIEVRSNNHIALLFVKNGYHRSGIAKKLLGLAIEKCKRCKSDLGVIEVNSSPYAVYIYERLGFVKTNSEQIINGIRFTPMVLNLR